MSSAAASGPADSGPAASDPAGPGPAGPNPAGRDPARPDPDSRGPQTAALDLLAEVAGVFERIHATLQPLAQSFADLTDAAAAPGREDLAALRPLIHQVLGRHSGMFAGAGVITAPGLLAAAPYWLEWWFPRPGGTPQPLRVNLDPAAPDFFDYTAADWYVTPQRTMAPHIAGPYVDHACTGQYAVTIALPVVTQGRPVGVAAADVLVSSLEPLVTPALRALPGPSALVNAAGRVIVSGSPDLAPGMRLAFAAGSAVSLPARSVVDTETDTDHETGGDLRRLPFTWQLVTLDS
jgi:hypothetical protein